MPAPLCVSATSVQAVYEVTQLALSIELAVSHVPALLITTAKSSLLCLAGDPVLPQPSPQYCMLTTVTAISVAGLNVLHHVFQM
jgi:hypothetical protein